MLPRAQLELSLAPSLAACAPIRRLNVLRTAPRPLAAIKVQSSPTLGDGSATTTNPLKKLLQKVSRSNSKQNLGEVSGGSIKASAAAGACGSAGSACAPHAHASMQAVLELFCVFRARCRLSPNRQHKPPPSALHHPTASPPPTLPTLTQPSVLLASAGGAAAAAGRQRPLHTPLPGRGRPPLGGRPTARPAPIDAALDHRRRCTSGASSRTAAARTCSQPPGARSGASGCDGGRGGVADSSAAGGAGAQAGGGAGALGWGGGSHVATLCGAGNVHRECGGGAARQQATIWVSSNPATPAPLPPSPCACFAQSFGVLTGLQVP